MTGGDQPRRPDETSWETTRWPWLVQGGTWDTVWARGTCLQQVSL